METIMAADNQAGLDRDSVIASRQEAARKRREWQQRHDTTQRLVTDAGQRYASCTLESFVCRTASQIRVVNELREYLEGDCCCGLVLYGPVGTGKDHLAMAVCKAAVNAGQSVRWVNGQKWFGVIRDAIDGNRDEASILAEVTTPDLLCLSDPLPPVGCLTQHQATMLYRLVDGRYARGKATVVTVNVASDAEADERLGAATWDRLCHDAWKIKCEWGSYRTPRREVT